MPIVDSNNKNICSYADFLNIILNENLNVEKLNSINFPPEYLLYKTQYCYSAWNETPAFPPVMHIIIDKAVEAVIKYLVEEIKKKFRAAKLRQKYLACIDNAGRNLLHIAVAAQRHKVVEYLLKIKEISLSTADSKGWTALHFAAERDNAAICQLLIASAKAANVNLINAVTLKSNTALHLACFRGFYEVIQVLVTGKANVKGANDEGNTPLHLAVRRENYSKIADLLIKNGASLNVKNLAGSTPKELVEEEAKPKPPSQQQLFDLISQNKIDEIKALTQHKLNFTDKRGWTIFHQACFDGCEEILEILLATKQFDVNEKTMQGRTALHLAIDKGHLFIVNILLDAGAKINEKDKLNDTPLHLAIFLRHLDIIELLLHKGADLTAQDNGKFTPIELAQSEGYLDVIRVIDEFNGSKVLPDRKRKLKPEPFLANKKPSFFSAKDEINKSLLEMTLAAKEGDLIKMKNILTLVSPEQINEPDKLTGKTLLHIAIQYHQVDMVKLLIQHNAVISVQDEEGNNPWHLALANPQKNNSIIKCLVSSADDYALKVKNKYDLTPKDVLIKHLPKELLQNYIYYKSEWIQFFNATNLSTNTDPTLKDILYLIIGLIIKNKEEQSSNPIYVLSYDGKLFSSDNLAISPSNVMDINHFHILDCLAKYGVAEAQYKLGVCYHFGFSTSPDLNQATHWYGLAAAQKYEPAVNAINLQQQSSSKHRCVCM